MNKTKVALSLSFLLGGVFLGGVDSHAMMRGAKVSGGNYSQYRAKFNSLKSESKQSSSSTPSLEMGNFNAGGKIVKLPIQTKLTEEGLEQKYVEHDGKIFNLFKGIDGEYRRGLFDEEVDDLIDNSSMVFPIFNTLGQERKAILTEGNSGKIGIDLETGHWRHVRSDDRKRHSKHHFEHRVDVDKLSEDIKSIMHDIESEIFETSKRYGNVK